MSHTLQPVIFLPHTYVPFSCPQLCGISHTQLPAHCAAVWVPCALGRHCPVPESHSYMTAGVGGGVGGGGGGGGGVGAGVGFALHVSTHAAAVVPVLEIWHCPVAVLQANLGAGVGAGVGAGPGPRQNAQDAPEPHGPLHPQGHE